MQAAANIDNPSDRFVIIPLGTVVRTKVRIDREIEYLESQSCRANHSIRLAMESPLDRLRRELEELMRTLNAGNLTQAPAEKWNPSQILEHLFLSYKGTNLGIARCLQKNAPLGTRPALGQRMAAFLVTGIGYMPPGRKSPAVAMPRGIPMEEVRQGMVSELNKMQSGLDECERKFGRTVKILDHPILGPLAVDEWRKLHWVHGKHHIRQIRKRIQKSHST
jgi:hypothetical protein